MEEALKREILEETGLKIYDIHLISIKESVYNDSFHEKRHMIFIDYICKTDSYDVSLNDEAQEYEWVDLKDIDNYELGGFLKPFFEELKNKKESRHKTEILYNY